MIAFVVIAALPLTLALSADAQRGRGGARAKDAAAATATQTHRIEISRDGGAAPIETVKANPEAGVLEAKTLDGGTRVFRFGEMEVEGRLRSPQIVYFLRRVRAEFAAGDLGHRSFMGELSETRKTSAF
ncbi:MAG TPA: hypothetical protein VGH87_15045 [Polyangiaceae bacterium]